MTASDLVFGSELSFDEIGHIADDAQQAAEEPEQAADGVASASSEGIATLATLADVAERANHYAGRSKSQATIDAYASDWRDFLQFCDQKGRVPCRPQTKPSPRTWPRSLTLA